MVDKAFKEQVLEDLELLTPEQQKKAAEYIHLLRLTAEPLPAPVDGRELLPLAGTLDDESARQMIEAIQESKRIDPGAW
jgi:hypothetical protein